MSERIKITAVADDGEHVTVEEDKDSPLHHLLHAAVRELYGKDKAVDKYELVINGSVQTNLDATLKHAGLHDGSEVVVQPVDVSRG
jgi:hypothetical protein